MLKSVVSWEVSVNFDLSTFFNTLECSESKNCCFYFSQKHFVFQNGRHINTSHTLSQLPELQSQI